MQLATRLSALQRTAVVAGHDLGWLLASLLSEGIEALATELQQLVESTTLLSSSPPTRRWLPCSQRVMPLKVNLAHHDLDARLLRLRSATGWV